ncbi:endoribonuclease L-PSP family protein [Lysobacter enzymogenes]|uniref:Endoribonuclease L-PSP family protein n=1 Tax=Lysobacter enzymogenes TaxID=69 RepID=A0A0S2DAI8_LYSEN|nr:endoribonuclease L-PSP family protein [Lysobacter enzymogenes]QCW24531.1 RidA family protein [Lysobacter enzymogenes]
MRWCVSAVGLSLCFLAAAACAGERPEFLASPDPAAAALPFSEAVRSGELLFLSGQIGTVPGADNALAKGGIGPEAEQTLSNIRAVLERHGASMRDVVKCTVFLADIGDWPAFNAVYRQHFSAPFPARSALAASGLAMGAKVEVECIAQAPRKAGKRR